MTKDFEVTLKVRNNRLLTKMRESGIDTARELAKRSGISYASIILILSMKKAGQSVFNEKWRPVVVTIAEFLGCMPEDIIPEAVRANPLAKNTSSFTIDAPDVEALISNLKAMALPADAHLDGEETKAGLRQVLLMLPAREERILRQRFGLGCEAMTLEQIGDEMNLSKDRIRQLEWKAIDFLKRARKRAGTP